MLLRLSLYFFMGLYPSDRVLISSSSWYDKTSNGSSQSARTAQAKHMLKEYVGALINGVSV